MAERDYKSEFKELVNLIKEIGKNADGSPLRNEDIAARLHYERTHFSKLMGSKGAVTERHVTALKNEFTEDLNAGNAKQYVGVAPSDITYIRLLEERLSRTEAMLERVLGHLDTIEGNQIAMAAMSDSAHEQLLMEVAERKKLEPETFLRSVRNKAISKLRIFQKSGIAVGLGT